MKTRAALAVLVLASLALAGAGSSPAAFPSSAQRLVVGVERFGGLELAFLDPGTGAVRHLGLRVGYRGGAAISPDGTRIAFAASLGFSLGGDAELFVGGFARSFRIVTDNESSEGRPAWTPDGRQLVFASDRDGDWDVYATTVPEGDAGPPDPAARNLTADSPAAERNPRVSPDGRLLAFESDRAGDVDVYVAPLGGGTPVNVTLSPGVDELGDWAPDSSRLVVASAPVGGRDVYVVPAAGGTATRIAGGPGEETRPFWSPDGSLIAFSSDRDGDNDVFVVRTDGTGERQLTRNDSEDLVHDWQPLRDTVSPVVQALPSTGRPGGPIVLRYRASDDSGRVALDLELRYGNGVAGIIGAPGLRGGRAGEILRFRLPRFAREPRLPQSFTFCLRATDPSGNESGRSCARYRTVARRAK